MTVSTDQRLAAAAGTPPTTGAAPASPPAWHPDPLGRFPLRYWDGAQWTANVVNAERQVGIDRGWAEAMAAAGARSSAAPAVAPAADVPSTAPTPSADRPAPAPMPAASPEATLTAAGPPVEIASPASPTSPATSGPVEVPVDHAGERPAPGDERPVERFDISPAAVMGPRAPVRQGADPEPGPPTPAHPGAEPAPAVARTGPRRWGRSGAPDDTSTPPGEDDAEVRPSLLTRIGGVRVLAVAGVALVVLVVGLGLAWASASRSYDAQEAWQRRAEQWEERAGDHANERDEAIARIGRSRGRNRELTEENAEQQRQIEDLAADNAALTDENRLLNDALNSLGYELAP